MRNSKFSNGVEYINQAESYQHLLNIFKLTFLFVYYKLILTLLDIINGKNRYIELLMEKRFPIYSVKKG